tara:strand:- start:388 stop:561 length:174 start_codon:yes stop_codon:yes gene_type:complete
MGEISDAIVPYKNRVVFMFNLDQLSTKLIISKKHYFLEVILKVIYAKLPSNNKLTTP